jgi:hypothetical protein
VAWALACFCVAFLFTDFGDRSPIIILRLVLSFTRPRKVSFSEDVCDVGVAKQASQTWNNTFWNYWGVRITCR